MKSTEKEKIYGDINSLKMKSTEKEIFLNITLSGKLFKILDHIFKVNINC